MIFNFQQLLITFNFEPFQYKIINNHQLFYLLIARMLDGFYPSLGKPFFMSYYKVLNIICLLLLCEKQREGFLLVRTVLDFTLLMGSLTLNMASHKLECFILGLTFLTAMLLKLSF